MSNDLSLIAKPFLLLETELRTLNMSLHVKACSIELRWCAEAAWYLEVRRVAPKIPSDCSLAWCHTVTPRHPVSSGKATLTMTVLCFDWLTPPARNTPRLGRATVPSRVFYMTGLKGDAILRRIDGSHIKTLPKARPRPRSTSHTSSAFISLRFALSPRLSPTVSVISSMPSNTLVRFASVWR
jgi:hypothetical protein